jgi:apolipoprotein N-acyltransferase
MPRLLGLALSSAILLALALPNEAFRFGSPPLGFIALVPLYVALVRAPSFGAAALLTSLFGASVHALSSYWLYFFKDFAFWTLGTTTIAYGIIYAVLGLYLYMMIKQGGVGRPVGFAIVWTVFEYMKSTGFLGYPWGLIPYSLTRSLPLLQIADITGVYGISAALALSNAAIAETLLDCSSIVDFLRRRIGGDPGRGRRARTTETVSPLRPRQGSGRSVSYLAAACLVMACISAYGFARLSTPVRKRGSFDAVLVQQNLDPWESVEETGLRTNIELAERALTSTTRKPDLIMFSETSLRRPYEEFYSYFTQRPLRNPFVSFIKRTGTRILTGAPIVLDWDKGEATNSVILIGPDARVEGDYAKIHPVPFAEAIPFWEYKWFRDFIQGVVGLDSGWVMGTEFVIFELPTGDGDVVRFGAPICFEDAFADLCRTFFLGGADILINLTNDSWSRTASAEIQHWAAARFRAIEFRRTLVRSTNGGYSCVVGPYGEVLADLPLFMAGSRAVEIPVYADEPTMYHRFGDWFALFMLLLSAAWVIIIIRNVWRTAPVRRRRGS